MYPLCIQKQRIDFHLRCVCSFATHYICVRPTIESQRYGPERGPSKILMFVCKKLSLHMCNMPGFVCLFWHYELFTCFLACFLAFSCFLNFCTFSYLAFSFFITYLLLILAYVLFENIPIPFPGRRT